MDKRRLSRPSGEQKRLLVNFMEEHLKFARSQETDSMKVRNMWRHLMRTLNASGGANKGTKQWQRCWSDWKSAVKTKATKLSRNLQQTGGAEGDSLQELSEIERRVLQIIGGGFSRDGRTKELPVIQISQPVASPDPAPEDFPDSESEDYLVEIPPLGPLPLPQPSTSQATTNGATPPRGIKRRALRYSQGHENNFSKLLREKQRANDLLERQAAALERQATATEQLVDVMERVFGVLGEFVDRMN
ncbi:uncharacterized protein LOC135136919 [Zophobas morio]|uniref:uncharacterized protein LOC135136919 n=1 Tax=Zophobas morio TaxID=2755281 RepID=UPI003083E55D